MDKLGKVMVVALAAHAIGSHILIPALIEERDRLRHQNEQLKDLIHQYAAWGSTMSRVLRLHMELGGEIRTNEAGNFDVESYLIFSRENML